MKIALEIRKQNGAKRKVLLRKRKNNGMAMTERKTIKSKRTALRC
jgi:hypothetical protein